MSCTPRQIEVITHFKFSIISDTYHVAKCDVTMRGKVIDKGVVVCGEESPGAYLKKFLHHT